MILRFKCKGFIPEVALEETRVEQGGRRTGKGD